MLHTLLITTQARDVIIVSPDTDAFIIRLSLQSEISAKLYFHTSRGVNFCTIDLKQIEQTVGSDVCKHWLDFIVKQQFVFQ